MNPLVDEFLNNAKKWQDELTKLRSIIVKCNLVEDFKWKHPCYTHNNKNIVLIHGFKDYVAILFYKGAILKDSRGLLVQQTENVQYGRQMRFTTTDQIDKLEPIIKAYIAEAIENENLGLSVKKKETSEFNIPEELIVEFEANKQLKAAFENLTPGRQRGLWLVQ